MDSSSDDEYEISFRCWLLLLTFCVRGVSKGYFGVLGEGVDSARGVAATVVCRRNSSCNSSCRHNSSQWSKNYCIIFAALSAIVCLQ